jgi:Kef-type K+ transport system membrane component KefB
MERFWKVIREIEWYAVIAIVLLVAALVLAVLIALSVIEPLLWVLAIILTQTAIVSAVFSHRT